MSYLKILIFPSSFSNPMSLKTKKTHLNKIKVRYSEVDCQRIVYNSHYLTYFDISLSEMLEDCFDQDEYVKKTNNDFHTVGVCK